MAAGMMRDRSVLAVLALFRSTRILARLAGAGAFALAVVAGAATAEEVPRSRAQIVLSFCPGGAGGDTRGHQHLRAQGAIGRPVPGDPPPLPLRGFRRQAVTAGVPENSRGSGVIVAADGLIVTNHHVILREHQLPGRLDWSAPGAGSR
jgi:serine protease Do